MNRQKAIILLLVAGILVMQLDPVLSRKSKGKSKSTKTGRYAYKSKSKSRSTKSDSTSAMTTLLPTTAQPTTAQSTTAPPTTPASQIDEACLANFAIQAVADIGLQMLTAVGECLPVCGDAPTCIACFAAALPIPALIPTDCGTSLDQNRIICIVNYGVQTTSNLIFDLLSALGSCLPCTDGAFCASCFSSFAPTQPAPLDCPA